MRHKTLAIIVMIMGLLCYVPFAFAEDPSNWEEAARLSVTAVVAPYTSVKFSTSEITFDIKGEPGEYEANELVEVSVGSNQAKWSVHAHATELIPESAGVSPLPASRLAFSNSEEDNFMDLGEDRLVIEGDAARPPAPLTLKFALTTEWEDLPSTYRGNVIFTFLSSP